MFGLWRVWKNSIFCFSKVFSVTLKRLKATDIDQEVKERAISCMGHMVCHLGDHLQAELRGVLAIFLDRLKNEITRLTAVRTITLISASPLKVQFMLKLPQQRKRTPHLRLSFLHCFAFSVSSRSTCRPSCQKLCPCWDLSWGRTSGLWSSARWRVWPRWSRITLPASNLQHWSPRWVNFLLWWMRATCTCHRYCTEFHMNVHRSRSFHHEGCCSGRG